ncbi:TPA: hypothetical protein ACH3X1_016708 [Trebouxia sp. C0004]
MLGVLKHIKYAHKQQLGGPRNALLCTSEAMFTVYLSESADIHCSTSSVDRFNGSLVGKCWPLATLTIKVFPGCQTGTVASSASHGQDGQMVIFCLLVGRPVMIGKLLGFRCDVCPLVVLSVVIGQMLGSDQQFKGTSNKCMGLCRHTAECGTGENLVFRSSDRLLARL